MKAAALIVLVAACVAGFAAAAADFELEDNVIVLTDDNFDDVVQEKGFLLAEFYAPWCGHCKNLVPEYAKAATDLKGSDIFLGKLDATVHTKTAGRFNIRGYPTIKFFKNGVESEYNGGRTASEIVSWLKKRTGPSARTLDTVEAAKEFSESAEVAVIGFFSDVNSAEARAFIKVADSVDDIPFGITSDAAIASEFKVDSPAIVLFKKFDEGRNEFTGGFNSEEISKFVQANQLPLIIEFLDSTAQKIFGGEIKKHVLVFLKKSSPSAESLLNIYRNVAARFRGQLLFVFVDADKSSSHRVLDYFGIKQDELPDVRLINMGVDAMEKYRPAAGEITEQSLSQFIEDYIEGRLDKYLMSAELPEDWNRGPVTTLVGKNHDEVVYDDTKNVFVEYYAPWCGHCKKLVPIWEELGTKFADRPDIVIAKMDSTVNEAANLSVQGFPTLKFYPAGSRTSLSYDGGRTLEDLTSFVEKNAVEVDGQAHGHDHSHEEL